MTQKKSPYCNKDDPPHPHPRLHTQTIIRKNPQETKGRKQQNNKERIGSDINNNIKTCPPPPQSERNPKQCWICGSLLYSTFLNDSYLRWVNHFRFMKFARLGGGVSWRVSIFPDPLPGHWKEIAMLDYFEILELCSSKHGREHPIWFWPEFNTF